MDLDDIAFAGETVYVRGETGQWQPASTEEMAAAALALLENTQKLPAPPQAFLDAVDDYLAPTKEKFNYDQMRHTYVDATRFQRWAAVVARHKSLQGARVLSSGCGAGGSVVAWWATGAEKVVGLEIDPALVELATLRLAGLPGASAQLYDGQSIPLDDASVDVVESLDVLEHVPHPHVYIAELRRILKPGGFILLVTPNRLWPFEQHVNLFGPTWMSIEAANRVYPALASRVQRLAPDLAWRMERLPAVREFNVSFRKLRRFAKSNDLFLHLLNPDHYGADWPVPPTLPGVKWLSSNRLGKFVAPTRHLAVLLEAR